MKATLKRRRLGTTDLELTTVGRGAWAIGGGGWAYSWGPQDDADSVAAIHAALDAGWNWIDSVMSAARSTRNSSSLRSVPLKSDRT